MDGAKNIHLIESMGKKANFLRLVSEKLELKTTIDNRRVELLKIQKFDVHNRTGRSPLE